MRFRIATWVDRFRIAAETLSEYTASYSNHSRQGAVGRAEVKVEREVLAPYRRSQGTRASRKVIFAGEGRVGGRR